MPRKRTLSTDAVSVNMKIYLLKLRNEAEIKKNSLKRSWRNNEVSTEGYQLK